MFKQSMMILIFSILTIIGHFAIALSHPGSGCSKALHECVEDSVKFVDKTLVLA